VVRGDLAGREILIKLSRQVEALTLSDQPSSYYALNADLLWHMAHCPRAMDRRILLAIATDFQDKARIFLGKSLEDPMDTTNKSVLFSPITYAIWGEQDLWLEKVFPGTSVDWKKTFEIIGHRECFQLRDALRDISPTTNFPMNTATAADLARQITLAKVFQGQESVSDLSYVVSFLTKAAILSPQIYLSARYPIPTYQEMMLPSTSNCQLDTAVQHMQRALAVRGLMLGNKAEGENDLSLHPRRALILAGQPGSSTFLFEIDDDYFLTSFVRHQWTIGYGTIHNYLNNGFIDLRIHIFKEYRGTSCSVEFLRSMEQIAREKMKAKGLLICLDLERKNGSSTYLGDDLRSLLRFYNQNGYWFDKEQGAMVKYLQQ